MKRIIVSCENAQELTTLNLIVSKLQDVDVVYFDTVSLYEVDLLDRYPVGSRVQKCRRIFNKCLARINIFGKAVENFYVSWQLFNLIRREGCYTLVVGVPLFSHRIIKFIFREKLLLVTFLRSVIVGSEVESEFGLRWSINNFFRKKGLIGYVSDICFCSGGVTERFMLSQGCANVHVVGPFDADLNMYNSKDNDFSLDSMKAVVFVTGAFSWHGDDSGHDSQIACLGDIERYCNFNKVKLYVLSHPRSSQDEYACGEEVDVVSGGLSTCLSLQEKYEGSVLFVSMFSTLSFELSYLGCFSYLVSTKDLYSKYGFWYDRVGVMPAFSFESIDDGSGLVSCGGVFYEGNRGAVVAASAKILTDCIS